MELLAGIALLVIVFVHEEGHYLAAAGVLANIIFAFVATTALLRA